MKNMKVVVLIVVCVLVNLLAVYKYKEYSTLKSISDKIIRFHVIANSDTNLDQSLKLNVRNKVLEYMYPKLDGAENIEECRNIINQERKNIKKIANKVIKNEGYNYDVALELGEENFPIKTYGNITLPQGKYEALRIIIGEGKGHNWWCVMFPPLCFVDITKGEKAFVENETKMKTVLTDEEFKMIDNREEEKIVKGKDVKENKVKFKFKILEVIEDIL